MCDKKQYKEGIICTLCTFLSLPFLLASCTVLDTLLLDSDEICFKNNVSKKEIGNFELINGVVVEPEKIDDPDVYISRYGVLEKKNKIYEKNEHGYGKKLPAHPSVPTNEAGNVDFSRWAPKFYSVNLRRHKRSSLPFLRPINH